jgi:hypothetical protein
MPDRIDGQKLPSPPKEEGSDRQLSAKVRERIAERRREDHVDADDDADEYLSAPTYPAAFAAMDRRDDEIRRRNKAAQERALAEWDNPKEAA